METVRSADGTVIAFDRSGTGLPLVLVGGAFNTRMSASGLAALLSDRFTVYCYDRRGRGDSGGTRDAGDYDIEWEVQDLAAVLAATGGDAFVYGHSSGGSIALESSARGLAMQKLAVYEPPYAGQDGPTAEFAERLRSLVENGHRDEAAAEFMALVGMPQPMIEQVKQSPYFPAMAAMAHTLPYDVALANGGVAPTGRLEKVTVPTLAIAGGASPAWATNAAQVIAEYVPEATYVVLQGQDHNVSDEVLAPVLAQWFGQAV